MMELVEAGGFPLYYKGQMVFVEAGRGVDGFKGVSPGKGGRFYGRIGGLKKGGHVSVPGTYKTSAEAAAERALYKTKLESKELTAPGPKGPRLARGTGATLARSRRVQCDSSCACACAGKIAKSKEATRIAAALDGNLENAPRQHGAAAPALVRAAAEFGSPASGMCLPTVHVRMPLSPNTVKSHGLHVEVAHPLCM